jgi:hypothetical protein
VKRATTSPAAPPNRASRHDELAPARSDREPDRHLAGARRAAHQQQVRDVRARDQQHERADTEEQRERSPRAARERALAPSARRQLERLGAEALQRLLAHAGLQRRLDLVQDRLEERVARPAGLLERHARLPAREEIGPVAAAVLEAFP